MDARTNETLLELQRNQSLKSPRRVSVRRMLLIGLFSAAALAICAYGYYWWTTGRASISARQSAPGSAEICQRTAGHPRLAPALAALFNEPARAWSLPELARLCNMSRATLARQFQEKLGRSANDLLTDIRMTLAANELRKPSTSTGAVADAVGYQSETAFQRAFKNYMGLTPAQWRKGTEFSKADHGSVSQHEELRSPTLSAR